MTKLENLDAGYRRLLEAEEALFRAGEADLAQAAYVVAAGVVAETRANIESSLAASADAREWQRLLKAASELDGHESPLVARVARQFANAAEGGAERRLKPPPC